MDAALGDGLALGVEAGCFVNGDVANGAGWENALGAGHVEGTGVIEAVEGIDAGDPGEDAAFFLVGEERDVGIRIRDFGFRIFGFGWGGRQAAVFVVGEIFDGFDGITACSPSTLLRAYGTGGFRWTAVLFCVDGLDHMDKIRGGLVRGNFGGGWFVGKIFRRWDGC